LGAILYISKVALEWLPNIELVSFLTVLYAIVFGAEAFIIVTVFNMIELVQWGFGTWWFAYLVVWPLLALIAILLKKVIKEEFFIWAIVSGLFGLFFGSFFALPYLFVDPGYALSYWISGLPWDLVHCIGNFVIMLILGKPMKKVLVYCKGL